jgi:Sensors of blue-light using FAD
MMKKNFRADIYDVDQLVYCSLASEDLSVEEIDIIVEKAQYANMEAQITGVLVVNQGVFLQWIEGPRHAIDALWRKLLADPRHKGVVRLMRNNDVPDRVFAGWAMQLATREHVLNIVQDAHRMAVYNQSTTWGPAIEALVRFLKSTEPRTEVQRLSQAS